MSYSFDLEIIKEILNNPKKIVGVSSPESIEYFKMLYDSVINNKKINFKPQNYSITTDMSKNYYEPILVKRNLAKTLAKNKEALEAHVLNAVEGKYNGKPDEDLTNFLRMIDANLSVPYTHEMAAKQILFAPGALKRKAETSKSSVYLIGGTTNTGKTSTMQTVSQSLLDLSSNIVNMVREGKTREEAVNEIKKHLQTNKDFFDVTFGEFQHGKDGGRFEKGLDVIDVDKYANDFYDSLKQYTEAYKNANYDENYYDIIRRSPDLLGVPYITQDNELAIKPLFPKSPFLQIDDPIRSFNPEAFAILMTYLGEDKTPVAQTFVTYNPGEEDMKFFNDVFVASPEKTTAAGSQGLISRRGVNQLTTKEHSPEIRDLLKSKKITKIGEQKRALNTLDMLLNNFSEDKFADVEEKFRNIPEVKNNLQKIKRNLLDKVKERVDNGEFKEGWDKVKNLSKLAYDNVELFVDGGKNSVKTLLYTLLGNDANKKDINSIAKAINELSRNYNYKNIDEDFSDIDNVGLEDMIKQLQEEKTKNNDGLIDERARHYQEKMDNFEKSLKEANKYFETISKDKILDTTKVTDFLNADNLKTIQENLNKLSQSLPADGSIAQLNKSVRILQNLNRHESCVNIGKNFNIDMQQLKNDRVFEQTFNDLISLDRYIKDDEVKKEAIFSHIASVYGTYNPISFALFKAFDIGSVKQEKRLANIKDMFQDIKSRIKIKKKDGKVILDEKQIEDVMSFYKDVYDYFNRNKEDFTASKEDVLIKELQEISLSSFMDYLKFTDPDKKDKTALKNFITTSEVMHAIFDVASLHKDTRSLFRKKQGEIFEKYGDDFKKWFRNTTTKLQGYFDGVNSGNKDNLDLPAGVEHLNEIHDKIFVKGEKVENKPDIIKSLEDYCKKLAEIEFNPELNRRERTRSQAYTNKLAKPLENFINKFRNTKGEPISDKTKEKIDYKIGMDMIANLNLLDQITKRRA